jgi:isoquinoline 1-oxidoreductase beta subunit
VSTFTRPVAPEHAGDRLPATEPEDHSGPSRRRFLGFLIAGPTLVAAAGLIDTAKASPAAAAIISPPEPSDLFDLGDLQDMAALPTSNLITVTINQDGTASFALPRAEVGQGITTSMGMLIAEELDLPLDKVTVTLADARPELLFNQLTGGSNTMRSMYIPVRTAAAAARQRLLDTAAKRMNVPAASLRVAQGVITAADGRSVPYGSLAQAAAVAQNITVAPTLKNPSQFTMIGTPQNRVDALDAVTGRKQFTLDLDVPGALPTMICRPPTINGSVKSVTNMAAVKAMPGITHVGVLPTGVAVRGRTFGQCIDAVRALQVVWNPGPEDSRSDADILAELRKAELPMAVPPLLPNPLLKTIDRTFTFGFASNSPLETGAAVADVRPGSAEIWSPLKSPIVAQRQISEAIGLPIEKIKVHVAQGGGSFGRHLFSDAAVEAARASKLFGVPVRLMWHRTDDIRQGRVHPMATSHVRATHLHGQVVTFEQRHTSVATDFSHGLGDMISSHLADIPIANFLGFAETIFELTANVPYNFGVPTQLLNEVDTGFHTGSARNIYSPDVCTAIELVVDQLAAAAGQDPYSYRKAFLKDDRSRAVLAKAAQVGGWGRKMPKGTAQGIAFHAEYKGVGACLVELDCRPATVGRKIRDAWTGPRVTKLVFVADVGRAVNPRGLEAQIMGGAMDGIASALTMSLHLEKGHFLEGSWDHFFYTRQWNVPPDFQVVIMPPTTGEPGGAGEFAVAATKAAVACAYARATGTMPTTFPLNHDAQDLGFEPLPTIPPIPQSPTDGLQDTF